jgi:hypothetical protein
MPIVPRARTYEKKNRPVNQSNKKLVKNENSVITDAAVKAANIALIHRGL